MKNQSEQVKILLDLIRLEKEIRNIHDSWLIEAKELDILITKRNTTIRKTNINMVIDSIYELYTNNILTLNIEERS